MMYDTMLSEYDVIIVQIVHCPTFTSPPENNNEYTMPKTIAVKPPNTSGVQSRTATCWQRVAARGKLPAFAEMAGPSCIGIMQTILPIPYVLPPPNGHDNT